LAADGGNNVGPEFSLEGDLSKIHAKQVALPHM
jgi:hypothetical protein